MDTKKLCELTSAADSLQLKPLVDLTSRALARIIEGKTPEEIRDIFHLPDDLTEEEKLEPLKNKTDDPRIRLLNRLYARKRKQLKEREKLKNIEAEREHVDDRSVDDLLSYINGGKASKSECSKSKKKNRRKKDHKKNGASNEAKKANEKKSRSFQSACWQVENDRKSSHSSSKVSKSADHCFTAKVEFEDGDIDDEIDPALKEEIDKEVEDFARRLNSDWPERMQEILSLGQERKHAQFPVNSNGSSTRYANNRFPWL